MTNNQKTKANLVFDLAKLPWISNYLTDRLNEFMIKYNTPADIEYCMVLAGFEYFKQRDKKKKEFLGQIFDLQFLSIVYSTFSIGADCFLQTELLKKIRAGSYEKVLSKFEGFTSTIEDFIPQESGEIKIYNFSENLRMTQKGYCFSGLIPVANQIFEVLNDEGKPIEKVESSNGKVYNWSRYHYDDNGCVDLFVKFRPSSSKDSEGQMRQHFNEVKLLKFKEGILTEGIELNPFWDGVNQLELIKPADKGWIQVKYDNQNFSCWRGRYRPVPLKKDDAHVSGIDSIYENPVKDNDFYIYPEYIDAFGTVEVLFEDKYLGRCIEDSYEWDELILEAHHKQPRAGLKKLDENNVEIKFHDKKAIFPSQVSIKWGEEQFLKNAFYD